MPTPNPDTHCPDCGELLSEYGHCWQHHYPPMDPAQDKQPAARAAPHHIPCGQCGACAVNEPCARLLTSAAPGYAAAPAA